MFYLILFLFFPVLLALVVPIGLALTSFGDSEADAADGQTALVPIVGLAALIVLISLALHLGARSGALVPMALAVNLGAAFFVRRARLPGRPSLARLLLLAYLAYLILAAPLFLAGRPAVTGYKVNNDTVFHTTMPEYLAANGYEFPSERGDAFTEAAYDKFVTQGYPDGWHLALLLAMKVWGRRAWELFNLTEAFFAALTAPIAFAWLRRAGLPRRWSLFGGLIAAAGFLQLSYLLAGFAPQAAIVPFIYGALLVFYDILVGPRRRLIPAAALLLQASVAIYSFTILLWLAVFVLVLLIYRLRLTGRPRELGIDIGAVGLTVVLAVAINPFTWAPVAAAYRMVVGWSAADTMGNLVSRSVPILPVLGIWPAGDHRLAPAGWLHVAGYAGALFALIVLVYGLRYKSAAPLLPILAVSMAVPAIVLKAGASPYYFAKTIHIAGPAVAIVVVAGVYSVSVSGRRVWAVLLALLYLTGAALSGWAAIRFTTPTPADRFAELLFINDRYRSLKPAATLFLATGEDWGTYLLAGLRPVAPFAVAYKGRWAPGMRPLLAKAGHNDLDSLRVVPRYDLLVIAKKQDISLPPPLYEIDYVGRFFNVYKLRSASMLSDITDHRPFEIQRGARASTYTEVPPGAQAKMRLKHAFQSLFISAYLSRPDKPPAAPAAPVQFFVGGATAAVSVGRAPHVYALALAGDSGALLRVKNNTPYPLRLDWVETLRRPHDQAALFRYNNKNKRVFQSVERLMSR